MCELKSSTSCIDTCSVCQCMDGKAENSSPYIADLPGNVTDPGWSHHPGSAQDTGDTRGQAEHGGGAGLTMRLDDLKGLS